jgi:hypothetical protein
MSLDWVSLPFLSGVFPHGGGRRLIHGLIEAIRGVSAEDMEIFGSDSSEESETKEDIDPNVDSNDQEENEDDEAEEDGYEYKSAESSPNELRNEEEEDEDAHADDQEEIFSSDIVLRGLDGKSPDPRI